MLRSLRHLTDLMTDLMYVRLPPSAHTRVDVRADHISVQLMFMAVDRERPPSQGDH